MYYSEPCKCVIYVCIKEAFLKSIKTNKNLIMLFSFLKDTFWWCFCERYIKLPSAQEKYFYDISENYVKLLFTEVSEKDIRYGYRNTFFKSFADLLSMSVYTIFVTCFPESYLTQFTESFKDFICFVCHLWISGTVFKSELFITKR